MKLRTSAIEWNFSNGAEIVGVREVRELWVWTMHYLHQRIF